jgi:AcrR family transcriptional regulator
MRRVSKKGGSPRLGRPPGADRQETRTRILDAALDLFAARGFQGTTTRDIAARAGLSDAGLYAHFGSKQEVFHELFRAAGPNVVTLAVSGSAQIARDQGPRTFVRKIIDVVLAKWSDPRARKFMGVVLRDCTLETRSGAPSLSGGIEEALREVAAAFEPWIKEGLLRSDFPAEHLAWELFAPLVNVRLAYLHPNASDRDIARAKEFARRHAEYFLANVITDRTIPK